MAIDPFPFSDLIATAPPNPSTTAGDVRHARSSETTFFVVLDDDPTGTQSVSDLPVLTSWEPQDFSWAIDTGADAVYVMTNSRSLAPQDARAVNIDVVRAATQAAGEKGRPVGFVSRSDSTLRGHYPLETDTIAEELAAAGKATDGVVIIPAFGDAGRITVDAIHYAGSLADGFLPVGQTEFAKDASFGYTNSDLRLWVAEKSHGKYPASQVIAIDLRTLRTDLAAVVAQLRQASDRQPIICDVVTEEDLRQLSLALIQAEAGGKRFIYRVGPPFMRARLGQEVPTPLTAADIAEVRQAAQHSAGGLIVVGSHVGLTTRQLAYLEAEQSPPRIEIDVQAVNDENRRAEHLAQVVEQACAGLQAGNVVISTSRTLATGADAEESLAIARRVSAAVVEVVQQIIGRRKPKFVIAKGGITSSDVAAKGLSIRHAMVVGPMLPGIVSLWSAQDGPAVSVPYIIFAGNVGDDRALAQVTAKLS